MIKDYCPGYLDPMAGGVVQFGESYEENAEREAEEEMGIKGVPLQYVTTFYYEVFYQIQYENSIIEFKLYYSH